MEKLKKSEETIVKIILDALKGNGDKNKKFLWDGDKMIKMPEMRNLTPDIKPVNEVMEVITPYKGTKFFGFLGLLIILFIIYKVIEEYFPNIISKTKTVIETKITGNSMFDVSNNLNSNEILDYLLGTIQKNETNDWCLFGESDGTRYCTLTQGAKCMSGKVFPTQANCVNPNLKIS